MLIIAGGVGLSRYLACITPFAALATLAALKLGRDSAPTVIALVWLANQAIGYGLLGYPWTWDSAVWGLAIGAAFGIATLSAHALSARRTAHLSISLPFMAAFATFELCLYLVGFLLPVSEVAFSALVVLHLFVINTAALLSIIAAHQLIVLLATGVRSAAPAPLEASP